MTAMDYIKIGNLDTSEGGFDPGLFECFQGIGGSDVLKFQTEEAPEPDGLEIWDVQNEAITVELDRLRKMRESILQADSEALPNEEE